MENSAWEETMTSQEEQEETSWWKQTNILRRDITIFICICLVFSRDSTCLIDVINVAPPPFKTHDSFVADSWGMNHCAGHCYRIPPVAQTVIAACSFRLFLDSRRPNKAIQICWPFFLLVNVAKRFCKKRWLSWLIYMYVFLDTDINNQYPKQKEKTRRKCQTQYELHRCTNTNIHNLNFKASNPRDKSKQHFE